jgi:pimeloyl-ACP methyl ester carboxylesterase
MNPMNRRELFRSAASVAAVAGLLAAEPEAVWGANATSQTPESKLFPLSFIETRDRAGLFYRDWGTGKPVVFIHGWAVNSDLWQYQMAYLAAQGLRCVTYDRRGHGRSSDPGRGYDFNTLSDDLAAVIEKLGLRDLTLVGHSMGCAEVVRYLTRHGASRVQRVAFVSASLPFVMKTADNPDGVDKSTFEKLRAGWGKDFPRWLGENARPFFAPDTSQQMVDWGIRMCLQTSLQAILECNRIDVETDFRPELPHVHVPTLVIHGDADVSAPLDLTGRKTAKLIPGSQLKVYEGAPHGLMFTHTDRLNAGLLAFIKS